MANLPTPANSWPMRRKPIIAPRCPLDLMRQGSKQAATQDVEAVSHLLGFEANLICCSGLGGTAGVEVLGPLPEGLPSFTLPRIQASDLVPVVTPGFAVALVSFADTSVLSRSYAARLRQSVDPNQEMIGLGAANLAAGFFQGFPISSSSSRTPVAESAGARTQLTGVIGAGGVALLLVLAPDLLRNLPSSGLAAVVIAAAIGFSRWPTSGVATASSAGSSGCPCCASWGSPSLAPSRASGSRCRRGDRVSLGRVASLFRGPRSR